MSTKKLALLVVAAMFLLVTGPAGAGGRVDWSDYIDPNPSKPVALAPAKVANDEAPTRSKKASRAKKKVGKSTAKARKKSKKARR